MPTINVYVSAELKAQMDAVGEGANWSAAAQEAFKRTIHEQEWKMQTDRIEKAAARLRASKQNSQEAEGAYGVDAGRNWVLDDAEYEELQKLTTFYDKDHLRHYELDDEGCSLADDIAEAIEIDADDLWERVTGEEGKWPTAHYAAGFVKGAVDAFRELKAKI